jgi:hypothetical protein
MDLPLGCQRVEAVNQPKHPSVAEVAGPDDGRRRLLRYVTWDAEEAAAFDHVLAQMRVVDEDAWRVAEPVRRL